MSGSAIRGGTFTFFSLAERKEKEGKNFSFLKERKVESYLTFLSYKKEKESRKAFVFFFVLLKRILYLLYFFIQRKVKTLFKK